MFLPHKPHSLTNERGTDMTTLIAAYNSDGCVGRCDERCYNAKHPECTCICGGKNHGAGLRKATENTRLLAEQMIIETNQASGQELKFEISDIVRQLSLF